MNDRTVTVILWTFVGVALVCLFAARVSVATDQNLWSHVDKPQPQHTCVGRYAGAFCP